MKTLTLVALEEWALLFDGEKLVEQAHDFHYLDITARARGEPVILRHVSGVGSALDDEAYEAGDVPYDITLSGALEKCGKSPRVGFAA